MIRVGNFEVSGCDCGWPVWVTLTQVRGASEPLEMRFTDAELSDMIYAASKALERANQTRLKLNMPLLTVSA